MEDKVANLKQQFAQEISRGKPAKECLKDKRLKALMAEMKNLPLKERQSFGWAINDLKQFLITQADSDGVDQQQASGRYLDVTAPWDLDQASLPSLLPVEKGSVHPIYKAQEDLLAVFAKMGFTALESRQLDSEFYMFDSLNFPPHHPARDEFDTFSLKEKDKGGKPLVAPAHTSAMQNRILRQHKADLQKGSPIAVVIPGRVFRNEDVDQSHDHMFYQLEGIYVNRLVTVANLIATLQEAMSAYFGKELKLKIQPFYFPFTEPSFEFAISCPFCEVEGGGCSVCSAGWIELLGCGMIHPNVLKAAEIDPQEYTGFAWGLGLSRLAMLKHGIEDIRHFASGKLEFLRQFKA